MHLEFPVFNYRFKGRKRSAKSILENYIYKSRNWQIGLVDDNICSKNLWRAFGELSEKITLDPKENFEILDREYALFIDFVVATTKNTSERLRSTFGETSEQFRNNFGDNKALLLFLVALNPEISAIEASKKIGVSDRTIENYFYQLKQTVIERIGSDKGGYWSIITLY